LAVCVFAFVGVLAGDVVDASWDSPSPRRADWLQKAGKCQKKYGGYRKDELAMQYITFL
jgi:hypothetical protein